MNWKHICESLAQPSASEPKPTPRELELEDRLSDLLSGFKLWRDQKTASMEWTTIDEMFTRWVEHEGTDL